MASLRQGARSALLSTLLLVLGGTGYAQGTKYVPPPAPIQIVSAAPSALEAPLYGRIEIEVALQATFENPFDPEQISVDAQITTATGKTYSLPGFYYQPFENGEKKGNPSWKVRLALPESGVTKVVIAAKDKTGTAQSKEIDLTATAPASHGFLLASERDFHFFEYTDGTSFFPIGSTLQPRQGLTDFVPWIKTLQGVGGNTARLVLGPEDAAFATTVGSPGTELEFAL